MRTYTNNLMAGHGMMVALGFAPGYAPTTGAFTAAMGKAKIGKRAKNVALFLAAPFVGLAYLMTFPFVGLAMLAWLAAKALLNNNKTRPIALAIAAPFIGLAFVTVGPVVGLAALVWYGGKAVLRA